MGLFKKKAPAKAAPAPEPETKRVIKHVNLPKTSPRVEVSDEDEGSYFKGCHLWKDGNKIRAFQGDKVIFEVTNRSKAFGELEKYAGRQLDHIVLRKKEGDYGIYYLASVAFQASEDEIVFKAE